MVATYPVNFVLKYRWLIIFDWVDSSYRFDIVMPFDIINIEHVVNYLLVHLQPILSPYVIFQWIQNSLTSAFAFEIIADLVYKKILIYQIDQTLLFILLNDQFLVVNINIFLSLHIKSYKSNIQYAIISHKLL